MKIEITQHSGNHHVCTIDLGGLVSASQIDAIANEPGGLSDLVGMGDSDIPEGYEWTGDEVYEVVS